MPLTKKKIILGTIAVAAVIAGSGGGAYWWTTGRFFQSTDDAYIHSDISVISPRIAGYVREVAVTDNQQVKAGAVLVVIDERDFSAHVAQAEAAADSQRAALANLDSRLLLQRALIDQAKAQRDGAQAEQHRAQMDDERVRTLAKGDWASRQRQDTADADLEKAEAALAQSRAAVAAAEGQVGVLQAERAETTAKLHQAEATLELDRIDLEHTVIRAPVDGVVGNRGVQVGQYVKPGTQLMAVVPLPEVYVVANFKETQLARMRPGQPVKVTIDAFPSQPLDGRVESFSPASGSRFSLLPPENATGNFTKIVQRVPVRIALPTSNALTALLRPGLSVEAEVDTRNAGAPTALAGGVLGVALGRNPATAAQVAEAGSARP
ncbi:MAG: HlyD family efflux transporter periplasmic adaptor subunit [Azospirillum sp.]|nr:HlyD family efflux transporter periplasmic adaptor subunit [Azospirillum sp.]